MTPFVHMLRTAMLSTSHLPEAGVMEKFMVLSDSTLPVKPFPIIFGELASTRESYYCFNNKEQWSKGSVDGVPMALPKHQQWVTLNRSEAALLVSKWKPVVTYQGWDVPLRGGRWAGQNRKVPRSTFKGGSWYTGTDEEATYAFTHGPLELRWKRDWARWKHDGARWQRNGARWKRDGALMGKLFMQRRCTTYVGFPDDIGVYDDYSLLQSGPDPAKQMTYPITLQLYRDPGNQLLVAEGSWHPFTIERLSAQSMLSLRRSDFLFARKFSANADLPNFTGIVLAA
uniref:Uncharacterized protein n=1 Tax=Alexandrium catenella TaxID=2925 RepID=A0A7S1RNM0_ALECA|mmetsp:Transcript_64278/g.171525  ORF Transcript_64278/g.171525 Transcript_64278/m.171525 type:complete len:285 (+) Transcript_64278:34-888(+)